MYITPHAMDRALHRAVPRSVVSAIHCYGTVSHHRGAIALRLDRHALELAQDDLPLGMGRDLRRYRDVYVVVAGATVVTVARSTRRRRN